MEHISLYITDKSKLSFLLELLSRLDFVVLPSVEQNEPETDYDFFASAGLWADRDIDAESLRRKAWKKISAL